MVKEKEILELKRQIYSRLGEGHLLLLKLQVSDLKDRVQNRLNEIGAKYGEQGWMENVPDEDNEELRRLYNHLSCLGATHEALEKLLQKSTKYERS